jgi:hypothetical protein
VVTPRDFLKKKKNHETKPKKQRASRMRQKLPMGKNLPKESFA